MDDPAVLHFIDRARQQGYFDGFSGAEHRPFFEDTSEMSWEQKVLYDDGSVEDAIRQAYAAGREFGQELDQT